MKPYIAPIAAVAIALTGSIALAQQSPAPRPATTGAGTHEAKAEPTVEVKMAKKWSDNGKDIAAFLSGANPNWSKEDLEEMLQKHLDLTTGEVVGRLNKKWAADIKAYDDGHVHMLKFADMLTDGIAKQFPNKFKTKDEG